jgi:hypothetical protein
MNLIDSLKISENEYRRLNGEFYTPKLWVDKSHEYIEKALGKNWKDECVVWDNSCGTGNLTKDYKFKDLILTTLEKDDIDVIKERGYNSNSLIRQMNFLNDEIPEHLDEKLMKDAKDGKRLVFFMNPPYGTAGKLGSLIKSNITNQKIANIMKKLYLGVSSKQLYTQFIFKCDQIIKRYGFQKYSILLFSPIQFMNVITYDSFRDHFYKDFKFEKGFMFNSGVFAGTNGCWAIGFTIWNEGINNLEISLDILHHKNFNFIKTGVKKIKNVKKENTLVYWLRKEHNKLLKNNKIIYPPLTSGLKIKYELKNPTYIHKDNLGYLFNIGNESLEAESSIGILSSMYSIGAGISILKENWVKVISSFSAKKLLNHDWINDNDEYLIPNTKHKDYLQWLSDCHVYTIMNGANNSTSIRNIKYQEKIYNIKNNFFWILPADAEKLYNSKDTKEIYKDFKNQKYTPFMANILSNLSLSPDAKKVLDKLNKLFIKSLKDRENYDDVNDDVLNLHLTSWDAGVYQLKRFWKVKYESDWNNLINEHKKLEDRLRKGVYKFGFLK